MAGYVCQRIFVGDWRQVSPLKRTTCFSVFADNALETFHEEGLCSLCDDIQELLGNLEKDSADRQEAEITVEEVCLRGVAAVHLRFDGRAVTFRIGTQYQSDASQVLPYTTPLHDPTSSEAWNFIESCVRECDAHHSSRCARTVTAFPRRVIDVDMPDIFPDVKLQAWDEVHQNDVYIALSYCWGSGGGYQQLTTTSSTLEKHNTRINVGGLSKTIQDAISVTRKLGKRYLWVDALCIIQDSDEDKQGQMGIMGEIYSSAYLTISAVGASGCDKGFLTSQRDLYFDVPYRTSDGFIHRIKMAKNDEEIEHVQHAILQGSPLNERGWCFQETILSPRILFYTNVQPYWRCPQSAKQAGGIPFKEFFSGTGIWRIQALSNDIFRSRSIANSWLPIAQLYSKRMFTNWDDRQPAIISLVKRLQNHTGDQYLAGHWRDSFIRDLLWAPKRHKAPESERPLSDYPGTSHESSKWGAPSWSWMSFYGPINYHTLNPDPIIKAKVLNKLESDGFGRIINGPLHIEGPIKQVLVPQITDWDGNAQVPPSIPCYDISLAGKQSEEIDTDPTGLPPSIGSISLDKFDHNARLDRYWTLETVLAGSIYTVLFVASRGTTFFGLVLQPTGDSATFRRVGELCASSSTIEYFGDAQIQALYIV